MRLKNQWLIKKKYIYLVIHIALKTMYNNLWYLDSGCFINMLGDKD
jgi:hypothetical protein